MQGASQPIKLSLNLIRATVEQVLGQPVSFAEDCIGLPAKKAVAEMGEGDILLLENTRFHGEETKNAPAFAASLAA